MLFNTLAISSLLVASAAAVAEPAPYKIVGKMSSNSLFGLARRQEGYQPTQTYCGPGTDCASSCGANYIQCPSSDGDLHCFDPTIKQACCPDGTGNSCDDGYYCTDLEGDSENTWCCPNNLNLAQCAAVYSLTGVLHSESATVAPTSTPSSSPASVSVSVTATSSAAASVTPSSKPVDHSTTITNTFYETTTSCSTTSTPSAHVTASKNATATYSRTASATPVQVTGGANVHAVFAGLPALALGVAGAILAL